MSISAKLSILFAGAFLVSGFASCDTDHAPDWQETEPKDVTLVSTSVTSGSTVETSLSSIELVYSDPVAVSTLVPMTLNGSAVTDSIPSDRPNTVVVVLPTLSPGTDYVLEVSGRTVAGIGSKTFAPAVSLTFNTPRPAVPVMRFDGLVNPSATSQAVNVYNFLVENYGKHILSGAMANVNNNNDFASWVKAKTGKDVAIMGYDFIHLPESGQDWIDYSDITPAETQWNANGLVSYMWHWRVPTDEQAWKDKDFSRYGARTPSDDIDDPTDFDIERALEEGTWEHDFIIEDLAKVAAVLKQLQDKGIPVIWRPLHEAAGDYEYKNPWFWWGAKGGEATRKLWRLMYDQLVNVHGCNNLIWVWTAQYKAGYEAEMTADYPGNDVVDIIGTDIYANNDGSQKAAYDALVILGGGKKLVTISETGMIQNPDKCFNDGAYWSWFNLWYTYNIHQTGEDTDGFGNTGASLKAVFESPVVINRDNMPSLK